MQTRRNRLGFGNRRLHGVVGLLMLAAALIPLHSEAQVLTARKIAHVPRSVSGFALNDWGWAVWATGAGNASQVYLWNGKTVTALGIANRNGRFPAINNNNWIVFRANRDATVTSTTDIFLSKGGQTPVDLTLSFDVADAPAINDYNVIAWGGEINGDAIDDIFLLRPGDSQASNLTQWDADGDSYDPQLNNYGLISWERNTDVNPGGETNLLYAKISDLLAGTLNNPPHYTQLTNSADLNVINGGINDRGKLVWQQYVDAESKYDIWQFDPYGDNKVEDISTALVESSFAPGVSSDGTVAWYANDTHGSYSHIFWNRGRQGTKLIPVPLIFPSNIHNSPIAVNKTGGMIFASGLGSGTGFDIYLVQVRVGRLPF